MKTTTEYLSLYGNHIAKRLISVPRIYIDDILVAENHEFQNYLKLWSEKFCSKGRIMNAANFMDMDFHRSKDYENIILDMDACMTKFNTFDVPFKLSSFQSIRAELLRTVNCKPGTACAIAKSCQATKTSLYGIKHSTEADKRIRNQIEIS